MDSQWLAIDGGSVAVLAVAFLLGLVARRVGLPPLVGFLAAGFMLSAGGVAGGPTVDKLADLGITLLLFTVGLKIRLGTLARPQVWAVSVIHMVASTLFFAVAAFALSTTGWSLFAGVDLVTALLIGFAFSFSSTVFAVKALESRGEMGALHGQVAIGILLMQDIAAVVFLAVSVGQVPSLYALLFLLLIPLRRGLTLVLERVGHGELLVLYGFILALGGAEVFELVGLKGDLGALVLGVLVAGSPKADELAKRMLGFKDLFLLAFFLSIGLSGDLSVDVFLIGIANAPLALAKAAGFFVLLTRFRMRSRTALFSSLNLADFSEFGLIVAAVGASAGLISAEWLTVIAVALSASFVMAAVLVTWSQRLYVGGRPTWRWWQSRQRLADDRLLDIGSARVAIIGMGRLGTGAFDELRSTNGDALVGIDIDPKAVRDHQLAGRTVLLGDPSDADFWDRVQATHRLELVLLALPQVQTSLAVIDRLEEVAFDGRIAAVAKYPDEERKLLRRGVDRVYNIYTEAGSAFAGHVAEVARDLTGPA